MKSVQGNESAEAAADRTEDEVHECIRTGENFLLEAGAGAGKTYSLVKALKVLIEEQGAYLQRRAQRVACITYTNVATEEIISRTDGHPVVHASTIHSFCWGLICGFQPVLRDLVNNMSVWQEKLEDVGGVSGRRIEYDLGYRRVDESCLYLHHDDVLALAVLLMDRPKFRKFLGYQFPVLFIDEYQDTNTEFMGALMTHFIASREGPLIGLFGDSWQKIYRDGVGAIDRPEIRKIGKNSNFRSSCKIVEVLNNLRPDLPQIPNEGSEQGSVSVFHTNDWRGSRQSGGHWSGDLPHEVAHQSLEFVRGQLESRDWSFLPEATKILMLTHNVLASEQNYRNISRLFRYNDSFVKKENPYIEFLVDTVEPVCQAFVAGRYGEMFRAIGSKKDILESRQDKMSWARDIRALNELRNSGTIGEVLDLLSRTQKPRIPEKVKRREQDLARASDADLADSSRLREAWELRRIAYEEIVCLSKFVNNHTVFSTKHSVKGAEFDNVLVVFGRGWNQYNWDKFLEWFNGDVPSDKAAAYERNRNLFYVACSRPRKRLSILFTQRISQVSMDALQALFGPDNIHSVPFE